MESNDHKIPNLVGTWEGVNKTLSELRGYKSWEKKVEITEQKDRRFKVFPTQMVQKIFSV